jgi:hypothetical protein
MIVAPDPAMVCRSLRTILLGLCCLAPLAACGDDGGDTSPDAALGGEPDSSAGAPDGAPADADIGSGVEGNGNNSAEFAAALGLGAESNGSLRKEIAIDGLPIDGFQVGPAHLSRWSVEFDTGYSDLILTVKNVGAVSRCFVHAAEVQLLTSDIVILDDVPLAYVVGSARQGGSSTCLGPGETGYILGIFEAPYAAVSTLRFDFDPGNVGYPVPASRVVPESLELITHEATQSIDVIARNVSEVDALLDPLVGNHVVGFDAEGLPLTWGSIGTCGDDIVDVRLRPNDGYPLCAGTLFAGISTTVRVFTAYEDPASAASSEKQRWRSAAADLAARKARATAAARARR